MPGGKKAKPPVSQKQRGAMYAAAAGKGNLGIPADVAREKIGADKPGKLPKRVKAGRPARGRGV